MAPRKKKSDPFGFGSVAFPVKPLKIKPVKITPIKLPSWEDFGFTGFNQTDSYDKKSIKRTPIPQSIKTAILLRSEGHCEKCNRSLRGLTPDIHHKNLDPGDHRKVNLMVVCPNCHREIHSK
jgi:hypothetical protein